MVSIFSYNAIRKMCIRKIYDKIVNNKSHRKVQFNRDSCTFLRITIGNLRLGLFCSCFLLLLLLLLFLFIIPALVELIYTFHIQFHFVVLPSPPCTQIYTHLPVFKVLINWCWWCSVLYRLGWLNHKNSIEYGKNERCLARLQ